MFGGSKLTMKNGMLKEVCRLQSTLMQFIHPKVREDFIEGLLGMEENEDLLSDINHIRRIVISPWRGRSVFTMQLELDRSSYHLHRLLEYSNETFVLSSKAHAQSHKDWTNFLSGLAVSTFWGITDPESICVNHITVPSKSTTRQSAVQKSNKINGDPEECRSDYFHEDQPSSLKLVFKDAEHHKKLLRKSTQYTRSPKGDSKTRRSKIDTISLTDSLCDSETSSRTSSGSSRRIREGAAGSTPRGR